MNLLNKAWSTCWTALGHVWNVVLDLGWSVWSEVQDGHSRASWWLLLGLVALGGACSHAWLWAS
jgi:hypothetical protein